MTYRHTVAALIVLVVGLVAPTSARAQVVPSPPWGEPIQDPSRFVVLASYNNQAVYDQETGLVWEQSPDPTSRTFWLAGRACIDKVVGNRKGWRLPTIQELSSLIDPTQSPTLPPGHPFSTAIIYAWSATTYDGSTDAAWGLIVPYGLSVLYTKRSEALSAWCVRGGPGVNPQ
jgi:hypothetical protein